MSTEWIEMLIVLSCLFPCLGMVQQQQEDDFITRYKRNFNIICLLMIIHQRGIVVIGRNRWGKEAIALPNALAFVMMILWASLTQDNCMWYWIAFWLLCHLRRRVESARLAKSGIMIHSQYDGWPYDAIRFCRTERQAKLIVEPILTGILGGMLWWIYTQNGLQVAGLPYYLLAGCVSLPFVESIKQQVQERRMQSMVDARIESEQMVRDVRDRYGDS